MSCAPINTEEATRVLKEFAASFAGTSYEDLCQYESNEVIREITAPSGKMYRLFLGASLVEVADPKQAKGPMRCVLSVSGAPIVRGRDAKHSLGGNADVMPGEEWNGEVENICVSKLGSMAGCCALVAVFGLAVFAIAYLVRSCTLAK